VFLYTNGKFTRLPNTYATDLNDLGQVLIYSDIGVAQIRQPNGEIVSYPIGDPNINLFGALALNDLGQVIGRDFVYPYGSNDLDFLNNVILVQPGGSYRIITNGGVDNYCFPVAMNILGQAVGHNYNLYWDNYYQSAFYDNGHAMLYNPDGQAVVLGNLFPGTTPEGTTSGSAAYGINSFGAIVGSCRSVFNGDERAFLYLNGTMYDINTLVNASGQGLTITEARGMNDLGQIVALAKDSAGNTHTVLLSVVGFKGSDALK
jgi:probable HAF family extracellular repeat protein